MVRWLRNQIVLGVGVALCSLGGMATAHAATVLPGTSAAAQRSHDGVIRAPTRTGASVTIDAATTRAVIPTSAFGINAAAWDSRLVGPRVAALLYRAGINVLRFPGGSTADVYHWRNNSITPGYTPHYGVTPDATFDAFMGVVQQV